MGRKATKIWLAVLTAAAVLLFAGFLWNREQEDWRRDVLRFLSLKDPGERVRSAEELLGRYWWISSEQRSFIKLLRAASLDQAGRKEEMEQAYRELIKENPNHHEALNNLAYGWAREGRNLDTAEAYARRAVDWAFNVLPGQRPAGISDVQWQSLLRLRQATYLDTYGWALFRQGHKDSARSVLKRADRLASEPEIFYHYGMALYENGQADSAISRLAYALAAGCEESTAIRSDLERIYNERYGGLDGLERLVERARDYLPRDLIRVEILSREALVGSRAPDFTLRDFDGARRSLAEQRGRVAILVFWSAPCATCRLTLPLVQKFYDDHRAQPVTVWGINLDDEEGRGQARRYAGETGLKFPMLIGERLGSGWDRDFSIGGVPTILVIDPDGVIRFRHIGYRSNIDRLLAANIESLLKEPEDEAPRLQNSSITPKPD